MIDELAAALKESKGEMQEYIANALNEISKASPEDLPQVTRIWGQNVMLKAAEIAVIQGKGWDRCFMLILQVGLAAASERILKA
jgi:hypothetical protein